MEGTPCYLGLSDLAGLGSVTREIPSVLEPQSCYAWGAHMFQHPPLEGWIHSPIPPELGSFSLGSPVPPRKREGDSAPRQGGTHQPRVPGAGSALAGSSEQDTGSPKKGRQGTTLFPPAMHFLCYQLPPETCLPCLNVFQQISSSHRLGHEEPPLTRLRPSYPAFPRTASLTPLSYAAVSGVKAALATFSCQLLSPGGGQRKSAPLTWMLSRGWQSALRWVGAGGGSEDRAFLTFSVVFTPSSGKYLAGSEYASSSLNSASFKAGM